MNTEKLKAQIEALLPTDEAVPYENSFLKIPCLKTTLLAYVERIEASANCRQAIMQCYLERFNFLINDYQNQQTNIKP